MKPHPAAGQWWRFGREEGRVTRILPGGAGDLGIAEFGEHQIPAAHVSTMLHFAAWTYLPNGPTQAALPPPCTCVVLDGGATIADGCAAPSGAGAKPVTQAVRTIPVTATYDGEEFHGFRRML